MHEYIAIKLSINCICVVDSKLSSSEIAIALQMLDNAPARKELLSCLFGIDLVPFFTLERETPEAGTPFPGVGLLNFASYIAVRSDELVVQRYWVQCAQRLGFVPFILFQINLTPNSLVALVRECFWLIIRMMTILCTWKAKE